MKSLSFVLLAALALTAAKCEKWEHAPAEEKNVVVLNDKNFDAFISKYENVLVEFYAPWCGHCKKLAPEYEKAAKALKTAETPVPLVKVDATNEKALASKYKVKGFPTLKWFTNGKARDYDGGRTKDKIVSWVKKQTKKSKEDL